MKKAEQIKNIEVGEYGKTHLSTLNVTVESEDEDLIEFVLQMLPQWLGIPRDQFSASVVPISTKKESC